MSGKRNDDKKSVVVVGGGGAGSYIARTLSSKLDASKYTLTLVTARPFAVHYPAAIRLTTTSEGKLEDTVLIPYDKLLLNGNGTIKIDRVVKIEDHKDAGNLVLASGESLQYDVLILAPGSHWEGPLALPDGKDEILEHIKQWRNKFESAKGVVLVGGGAVGIGTSAFFHTLISTSKLHCLEYAGEIRDYWPKKPVAIVQASSQLLNATYPDKFRKRMEKDITVRGVKVVYNDFVDNFEPEGPITTRGGKTLEGDLVVSSLLPQLYTSFHRLAPFQVIARGNRPATEFVSSLGSGVLNERGQIKVQPTLQLQSHPNIFAAGDAIDWDEQKQVAKYPAHGDVIITNVLAVLEKRTSTAQYKGGPELIIVTNGKVRMVKLQVSRRDYSQVPNFTERRRGLLGLPVGHCAWELVCEDAQIEDLDGRYGQEVIRLRVSSFDSDCFVILCCFCVIRRLQRL